MNYNKLRVNGFTIEEEKFMENVIDYFYADNNFSDVYKLYNIAFNTCLTEKMFKARFNDYITTRYGNSKTEDCVEKFLNESSKEFLSKSSLYDILLAFYKQLECKFKIREDVLNCVNEKLNKTKYFTTEFEKLVDTFIK